MRSRHRAPTSIVCAMNVGRSVVLSLVLCVVGCRNEDAATPDASGGSDAGADAQACTGTAVECAAQWEQAASDRFDSLLTNPSGLAAFLMLAPKGGDLHNHLSGA